METSQRTIGELAQVIAGFSPKPQERRKQGRYLLLGGRNIKDGVLVKTDADTYVDDIPKESFRRAIARSGDVIVSTLFDKRKLYVFSDGDPAPVVNSSCAIIRSSQSGDYIVSYLRTMEGERDFLEEVSKAKGGAFIPRVSVASLAAIQVPILPIMELAIYENFGFSPRGEAKRDIDSGFFTREGGLPVNTDGGLKCFGHPVGASGLRMTYEIYKQLQGKADLPERQIRNARLGLSHTFGGPPQISAVAVFGNEKG